MAHALGCYYAPEHSRQRDRDYIAALQPPVIRILDPDVQQIVNMHALAPGAILLPRIWSIDDNNGQAVRDLMADPQGTGRRHADQYRAQLIDWYSQASLRGLTMPPSERIMFNAANEPNQGGTPDKIAAYSVAFLNQCKINGVRAAALCLGVGWPDNTGPDTPVNWQPYADAGLVEAITRGFHWLELHEYFYKTGPQDGWRWLAGRSLQCPFDVPILLGEIGCDNYVDKPRWDREGGNRGWQGNVAPDTYAEMIEYHIRNSDKRVVAALPFITDYRNNEWQSFDTAAAHNALLARKDRMVPQHAQTATTPPVTTHLPSISTPPTPPTPPEPEPKQEVAVSIIDPLVGQTLIKVESGGQAFGPDGKLLIRFENHIFKGKLGNDTLYARHFQHGSPVWTGHRFRRSEGDPWWDVHTGTQASEYDAFLFAVTLNRWAAFESISMGLGQIMGFNARRVGFPSAEAMFKAFDANEANQVFAFINFFLSDPQLAQAVRSKDWRTIARLYNGPGNVNHVAPLLESTYRELGGA
jgi:hypothetical protein